MVSLSLLALASVAAATPLKMKRTITSSLLSDLDLFAQYSAAAYCTGNIDSATTGDQITCSADNCPLVEDASAVTLDEFDLTASYGDVAGFIAADSTNEVLVVSFRGTDDLENWIADLDVGQTAVDSLCTKCSVHSGFWSAWETVADTIIAKVEAAITTYPDYSVVFTGHSYGAALAAIGATVMRNAGYEITLYNYGQPRIGNMPLADYITDQSMGSNYRVTHTDDIVPKLPPKLLGFHHYSPEYWITSGNDVTVTTSDVTEVTGVDSTDGNAGTSGDSITAHRWYFIYISECD
ncbi:hypothetical protein ASPZODRAFT_149736 [Penicilliopsis zonata CBS 506.65]|uniref:Fungal lipase-like domain-containing protein n=1 Tax=Penicilliopsis zonata CBS 506.65 TaxID=1073090 RepID=A0A1L9STJ7_9EURO|nr:hypothetical protein ASPZODRAFT_149736 [Penicilliopsis zonata CBS 506.65]OJJ50407.1 hypothetical protein ASPZODRAFT_149736 [Penicilliopsis zonata CBS 506.65]